MKDVYVVDYVANKDGNVLFFESKESAENYFNNTLEYIKKVNKNKKYTEDYIHYYKIELSLKYSIFSDIKQIELLYNFYTENTSCIDLWDFMEQLGDVTHIN